MLTQQALTHALRGVGAILRRDQDGVRAHFDRTLFGFWQSFWLAALLLIPHLLLLPGHGGGIDKPWLVITITELSAYAMGWVAFPLLMIVLCDWLARWPRYFDYMVPYNWFRLVEVLASLPLMLAATGGVIPGGGAVFLSLLIAAALLMYQGWLAHTMLQISVPAAVGIVITDMVLHLLISNVTVALLMT